MQGRARPFSSRRIVAPSSEGGTVTVLPLMAQRLVTSRSQLDRVPDPHNLSIQLDALVQAASAVGKTMEIRLKRETKRARVTTV